jgi:hypothetical protein
MEGRREGGKKREEGRKERRKGRREGGRESRREGGREEGRKGEENTVKFDRVGSEWSGEPHGSRTRPQHSHSTSLLTQLPLPGT